MRKLRSQRNTPTIHSSSRRDSVKTKKLRRRNMLIRHSSPPTSPQAGASSASPNLDLESSAAITPLVLNEELEEPRVNVYVCFGLLIVVTVVSMLVTCPREDR